VLHLILGGAAVYRCDNGLIFIDGFIDCGKNPVSYQVIALAMT
jgi:hypothetical protein